MKLVVFVLRVTGLVVVYGGLVAWLYFAYLA